MTLTRSPAVAGAFYAADAEQLHTDIMACLRHVPPAVDSHAPKAIIAPHAGYVYSGRTAAFAYARVAPLRGKISRVVVLGPCHRVGITGLALSSADQFSTPLGDISVDHQLDGQLLALPGVQVFDATHAEEHSLEVHLPFLQTVLGEGFEIIPIVVGDASPTMVATVLDALWGGPETLIVVSSDLSHFLDNTAAKVMDQATCHAIENFDGDAITPPQACGRHAIMGLLATAKHRHMRIETLDLSNSGDTAGPKDRVVGYGAWALWESLPHAALLLQLAKRSILYGLSHGKPLSEAIPDALSEQGGCFVTLHKKNRLRGCIGSPEAYRALGVDVLENAYKAAFRDPRFNGLNANETDDLNVHISVLSQPLPFDFTDEADFFARLTPGVDGLILEDHGYNALFLPSVWAQLPDPHDFVAHLKNKAGLATAPWSDTLKAWRFQAAETSADWVDIKVD